MNDVAILIVVDIEGGYVTESERSKDIPARGVIDVRLNRVPVFEGNKDPIQLNQHSLDFTLRKNPTLLTELQLGLVSLTSCIESRTEKPEGLSCDSHGVSPLGGVAREGATSTGTRASD